MKTEDMIESGFLPPDKRRYLGASIIGNECPRALWYKFRLYKAEKITPRQGRLFKRGHLEEPIIIKDLKSIGIKVISKQESATIADGHISGHNDGILINVPDLPKGVKCLLEAKTANDARFKKLAGNRKTGSRGLQSIERWDKTYYIQGQVYMKLFHLKYCLFIVVNKNDDDRYYELIEYDEDITMEYLERGVDIINSETPPERMLSATPSYFYCKYFCTQFNGICYENKKPDKTCRSCKHSEPVKKGKWECNKMGKKISFKKQLKACKKYYVIRG